MLFGLWHISRGDGEEGVEGREARVGGRNRGSVRAFSVEAFGLRIEWIRALYPRPAALNPLLTLQRRNFYKIVASEKSGNPTVLGPVLVVVEDQCEGVSIVLHCVSVRGVQNEEIHITLLENA